MNLTGTITEIWRYPVKSMAGHTTTRAHLGELGIDADRRVALRELDTGKILSGKQPEIGRRLLALTPTSEAGGNPTITIGDVDHDLDHREDVNTALSAYLDRPVELVEAGAEPEVYESYWPPIDGLVLSDITVDLPIAMSTGPGTFVDLAAVHVITTATIDHLQRLHPDTLVDSRRFRPSLVVDLPEAEPFDENHWEGRQALIGGAQLRLLGPTPRCIMTTLEQPDLEPAKELLRTLASSNRQSVEGLGDFACAGAYAEVDQPGVVVTGTEIVISSTGDA